jgi:hypothetical protein
LLVTPKVILIKDRIKRAGGDAFSARVAAALFNEEWFAGIDAEQGTGAADLPGQAGNA